MNKITTLQEYYKSLDKFKGMMHSGPPSIELGSLMVQLWDFEEDNFRVDRPSEDIIRQFKEGEEL